MKTPEEIVYALRCLYRLPKVGRCRKCPYCNPYGCSHDAIGKDAAELIEQLLAQKGEE